MSPFEDTLDGTVYAEIYNEPLAQFDDPTNDVAEAEKSGEHTRYQVESVLLQGGTKIALRALAGREEGISVREIKRGLYEVSAEEGRERLIEFLNGLPNVYRAAADEDLQADEFEMAEVA